MNAAASSARDGLLLTLAVELLEAHLDTVELMLGWTDEACWGAHLDYLRALVRTTEAILAGALGAEEPVPAGPRAERAR
jgi:hypothetical protein